MPATPPSRDIHRRTRRLTVVATITAHLIGAVVVASCADGIATGFSDPISATSAFASIPARSSLRGSG